MRKKLIKDYFQSKLVDKEFKGKLEPGGEIGYWKIENRVLIKQASSGD